MWGTFEQVHACAALGEGMWHMISVGVVLLLLGLLLGVPILWSLGMIVLIVGLVLLLLGSTGRAIGGRRHYW